MEELLNTLSLLIKYSISSNTAYDNLPAVLSDDTVKKLYYLSKSHDLAHLVGSALIDNNLLQSGEIESKFKEHILSAVYRRTHLDYEYERLSGVLSAARIPFIPLKGTVLCKYYPEPWMRTSCDIDVLIHKEDIDSAIRLLSGEPAYTVGKRDAYDISLYASSGIHIELHFNLLKEGDLSCGDSLWHSIWEYAVPDGGTRYMLNDAMFYYYHIAHMAKHILNGGCGIRPFVDIWVLNHNIGYDREKRVDLLRQGGLYTFAAAAERLSEVWFGNAGHNDATKMLENYILPSGVYGSMRNKAALQQSKNGNKVRYVVSRIWQPYEQLKYRYPSLEKHRALLPLYEIRRWFGILFGKRTKRSINELKANSSVTASERKSARRMLESLELL